MSICQRRSFTKFSPCFVDESLFGTRRVTRECEEPCKDFDPPWVEETDGKKRNKPLLFYCPSSVATTNSMPQTSLGTPKSNSRLPSARNKKQHIKFSPSYVDESLFKTQKQNGLRPPKFEPPWVVKDDKSPRPILWDYSGGRPWSAASQRQGSGRIEREKNGRTERMPKGQQLNIMDYRRPWR